VAKRANPRASRSLADGGAKRRLGCCGHALLVGFETYLAPGPAGMGPRNPQRQGDCRVPTAPRVIELPENLDMPIAAQLAESFSKMIGEPLEVDASHVGRLGASCLQVMLAAARTWKAEGDALTLKDPSPRFLEDLNLLGLEPGTFLSGVIAP
jgi:chemotaxis protein CheX